MSLTDETRPVRHGEELDRDRLGAYLKAQFPDQAGPLVIEQFPHGHSNLTYLVRLGSTEMVLRRPPVGNRVKTAHDMGREYRVLSRLCTVYPPAPRPLAYCDDEDVLSAPFYLMERRRGRILRNDRPPVEAATPGLARQLGQSLVDNLVNLHAIDVHAAGLADLGRPEGYVERQVTGWSERYRHAQTSDVESIDRAASWLAGHRPPQSSAALIHNDYKLDNLMLDPADLTRVVAVLDWEMATVGDPLMDLGTSLGYWLQPDDPEPLQQLWSGPSTWPGALSRAELADHYLRQAGRQTDHLLFYYVFGLFKIAVIVQQIYARYVRGATQDERFARLDRIVTTLGQSAERAIASRRL